MTHFIEFRDGDTPPPDGTIVLARLRDGSLTRMHAENVDWRIENVAGDVVAYAIQELPGQTADDIQVGGSHYKDMGVQPWHVMEAVLTREEFIGFLKGNLIKYAMRQGKKDSPDAGKWHHYRQKLDEVLSGNT